MATVTNNAAESRYEAHQDGTLAGFAEYELADDTITFTHTTVFDEFGGQGIGGALAKGALDDVRAQGNLAVVPLCPSSRPGSSGTRTITGWFRTPESRPSASPRWCGRA